MKWMVFKATIQHCKAILGQGQPGRMINFVMNHAPGATCPDRHVVFWLCICSHIVHEKAVHL